MFINCKHCRALVATDPVSDLPPLRCPRCHGVLRVEAPAAVAAPSVATLLRPAPAPQPLAADAQAADTPVPAPPAPAALQEPAPTATPAPPTAQASETPEAAQATADAAAAPAPAADIDIDPTGEAQPQPAAAPQARAAPVPAPVPASVAHDPTVERLPVTRSPDAAPPAARASPTFVRAGGTRAPQIDARQRRWLLAAIAALSLLLVLLILLVDRARLARDPGWRPLLVSVCTVLRCGLPPWREPAALTLLARDVRPDPDAPDHLLVHATFRNDARWAQAWPRMLLTLSDVDGRAIGMRAFEPAEYLATPPGDGVIEAGASATIALSIVEPEVPAVSFAFDFR
ncbi:DUF3426 domain-containing protein [Luteimonas sp. BDR2-5]|uniref:DUF3426 domain-containing protein n=1 Tax=Proluteimonas luteida TaxID=2878685 RepID=UPI001E374858|nr:DUF3426 domain-containing protein [Luteimonas sp. BDR2-5]MCD9029344.1 DUF3426 domain-containing protein [Luteimonas sp. BDR2-5]